VKLTIEPTPQLVELGGQRCRIWEGSTEAGTRVVAFIARVGVPKDASPEEMARFDRELTEAPLRAPADVWPTRLLID